MKRGFTLLELIIVIIIIGILATLGFAQYQRMVERSRGAEARTVLGTIRTMAIGYFQENHTIGGFNNIWAGVGTNADQIPNACRASNYFRYNVSAGVTNNETVITGWRCTGVETGKNPNAAAGLTIILTTNVSNGSDVWGGTGGY